MESKILAIDIETSSLLSSMLDYSSFPYKLLPSAKLHCVVVRNVETGETHLAEKEKITKHWLRTILHGCTHLVAHNGIEFDFPTLKLFDILDYRIGYLDQPDEVFGQPCQIIDTLLLSRLLSPDRYTPQGMGHSLHVWGLRLGEYKQDYRQACIEAGYLEKSSDKNETFLNWTPLLLSYCIQDVVVTSKLFQRLWSEYLEYSGWKQAFKMESKLADLGVRRQHIGFHFDVEKAEVAVQDLQQKMKAIADIINPILPPKLRNKGELAEVTPPVNQLKTYKPVYLPKVQIKKDGTLSAAVVKFLKNQEEIEYVEGDFSFSFGGQNVQLPYYEALAPEFTEPTESMVRFAQKVNGMLDEIDGEWILFYKGQMYPLPHNEPLETYTEANIDDIDHVKSHLIGLGWVPTEFRMRNLICDAKKQAIPYEKRLAALQRYVKETLEDGKYKEQRLEILELDETNLFSVLSEKIKGNKPVLVPTSPLIRVGVDKELCPNLTKLGEKVAFAKDFALYLTYKHRKNSIAGGVDIEEEWEYNEDNPPNSGYLNQCRKEDGRIPTPAITIGTNTFRFKHIGVANIPRVESVYGKEMRSLFCSSPTHYLGGGDFSALESRVAGSFCMKYTKGKEIAELFLAPKPNDFHQVTATALGISRSDGKQINYAIMYGCSPEKIKKMLGCSIKRAKEIYDEYWKAFPALKELKDAIEKSWIKNGKQFVKGIDGRKIHIRSSHSALNAVFQSTGVIAVKYTAVFLQQELEELGYCVDPFVGEPDICELINYHDEFQYNIRKDLVKIQKFETEEEGKEFIKNWKGEQLGSLSHDKKWYICLPNPFSIAFNSGIVKTEKLLRLNVPLKMDYTIHKNWGGTH